jgi:quercetin 2,3-dioxygenase
VSWLVQGEVLHRDSPGSRQLIQPGQLNLMTAGRAIAHSEDSPASRAPSTAYTAVMPAVSANSPPRARGGEPADLPEQVEGGEDAAAGISRVALRWVGWPDSCPQFAGATTSPNPFPPLS